MRVLSLSWVNTSGGVTVWYVYVHTDKNQRAQGLKVLLVE